MKPKVQFDPEFARKARRWYWPIRSIGQLMIVVALSGLMLWIVPMVGSECPVSVSPHLPLIPATTLAQGPAQTSGGGQSATLPWPAHRRSARPCPTPSGKGRSAARSVRDHGSSRTRRGHGHPGSSRPRRRYGDPSRHPQPFVAGRAVGRRGTALAGTRSRARPGPARAARLVPVSARDSPTHAPLRGETDDVARPSGTHARAGDFPGPT